MAACEIALSIPHILKGIICGLPPSDIQQAKKVSKTWQTTCWRSRQIQLAGTATPTTTSSDTFTRSGHNTTFSSICCMPSYDGKMRLHPGLPKGDRSDYSKTSLTFSLDGTITADLNDFVTSPRCCVVVLRSDKMEWPPPQHCVVYIPTGVKVRDVVEMAWAMGGSGYFLGSLCGKLMVEEALACPSEISLDDVRDDMIGRSRLGGRVVVLGGRTVSRPRPWFLEVLSAMARLLWYLIRRDLLSCCLTALSSNMLPGGICVRML